MYAVSDVLPRCHTLRKKKFTGPGKDRRRVR